MTAFLDNAIPVLALCSGWLVVLGIADVVGRAVWRRFGGE